MPIAFQVQGLYRLRRGRSRVDDFFAVFVGSILAVVLGIIGTLYFQTYYVPDELKDQGVYEVSQPVWALFLVHQRHVRLRVAGVGARGARAAVAGRASASSACSSPAPAISAAWSPTRCSSIASSASRSSASSTIAPAAITSAIAACRCSACWRTRTKSSAARRSTTSTSRCRSRSTSRCSALVEATNREGVDVHVVPDLLQFIALRARLENLDGVPIISLNDVPLRGFNSVLKRTIDVAISSSALLALSIPFLLIAALIRRTSSGPVFYTQERMGLDGKAFQVLKFRSMYIDAEEETGPVWARDNDPRCTPVGRWLRKLDLDELPQLLNVLRGDMSIVGPRPERPYFVDQFKHRIPQYMLRHKVKAGITGWAQVNGWRGNTSLEKRIEFDLYYIENWSVGLDIKIMWLTVLRGLQKHADQLPAASFQLPAGALARTDRAEPALTLQSDIRLAVASWKLAAGSWKL